MSTFDYPSVLRSHGYDDLAGLHDPGFERFTFVRELQRAHTAALKAIADVKYSHVPCVVADAEIICASCLASWPCPTRRAVEDVVG